MCKLDFCNECWNFVGMSVSSIVKNIKVYFDLCDEEYRVITVHPEWNFIFLVGKDRILIAYDMDRRKVLVIYAHIIRFCRSRGCFHMNRPYYLPYVPLFMESLAEQ